MLQEGIDPPFAEGPMYWMRKDGALTNQATTAGLAGLGLHKMYTTSFCGCQTFFLYVWFSKKCFFALKIKK